MSKKHPSRPERWYAAVAKAKEGLQELEDLRLEYEEWKDNVPENAQSGAMYEKLEAIVDLDIESAIETADTAEGIDLPRGFGKD